MCVDDAYDLPGGTTALRFGLIEELYKAGSMVFIVAARRGGRWHLLEVGSVYPYPTCTPAIFTDLPRNAQPWGRRPVSDARTVRASG